MRDHIRALVEAEHMHEYIAIEPDTGEYEFNEDLAIASQKLKERRPESLTCILRIGHKAAIRMGSGWPSGYKGTPIADSVQYDVFWSRSQEIYEAEIRQWGRAETQRQVPGLASGYRRLRGTRRHAGSGCEFRQETSRRAILCITDRAR